MSYRKKVSKVGRTLLGVPEAAPAFATPDATRAVPGAPGPVLEHAVIHAPAVAKPHALAVATILAPELVPETAPAVPGLAPTHVLLPVQMDVVTHVAVAAIRHVPLFAAVHVSVGAEHNAPPFAETASKRSSE